MQSFLSRRHAILKLYFLKIVSPIFLNSWSKCFRNTRTSEIHVCCVRPYNVHLSYIPCHTSVFYACTELTPSETYFRCLEAVSLGLTPVSHETTKIDLVRGDVEVAMKCSSPLHLDVEMKHTIMNEEQMCSNVLLEMNEDGEFQFEVRLPVKGEFSLGLFACKQTHRSLRNVCNYLISCEQPSEKDPFPLFNDRKIGSGQYQTIFEVGVLFQNMLLLTGKSVHGIVHSTTDIARHVVSTEILEILKVLKRMLPIFQEI